MNPTDPTSYHTASNLSFVFKVIERLAADRFNVRTGLFNLLPTGRSAYRQFRGSLEAWAVQWLGHWPLMQRIRGSIPRSPSTLKEIFLWPLRTAQLVNWHGDGLGPENLDSFPSVPLDSVL